jgi:hypothetical protein
MSDHPNKMFKEVEGFLGKYSITIVDRELARRHWKVWVTDGRKRAMVVMPASPSDHRSYRNIASAARRALREAP